MITRIELKNFMSHAHTVIEPAEGLTVLVGDNNTGKSAIINALQVICKNISGEYMVRHGEKECQIRVDTSEGNTLIWRRKGGTVSYNINGRDVHRLKGSVPDDLHDLLRLSNVEAENESFDIHFGEQKDPIFLLNSSPAKRATFFASSSDTIKLIEMQTHHKSKVKEAKNREAGLQEKETIYKNRIDTLTPVDEIGKRLEYLETEYENINHALEQISLLKQNIHALEKAKQNHYKCNETAQAVQDLAPPPVLEDLSPIKNLIQQLDKIYTHISLEQAKKSILYYIQAPPVLEETQPLSRLIDNIAHKYAQMEKNRTIASVAERLEHPPSLEDTKPLQKLVQDLSKQEGKSSYWNSKSHLLSGLESPPELSDTNQLNNLIEKINNLAQEVEQEHLRLGVLDSSTEPPAMNDPGDLKELIKRIQDAYTHKNYLDCIDSCLVNLGPPPEIPDISPIKDLINKMEQAEQECEKKRTHLKTAEKDLKEAEKELREHITKTDTCPTCGQKMDPEHILNQTVTIK